MREGTVLTDSVPEGHDHRELKDNGQQLAYVVLTPEERAKGWVRPYREHYVHVGLNPEFNGTVLAKVGEGGCGSLTTMSRSIAETYARNPYFYSGTFCVSCRKHLPLEEFVWEDTTEQVGT